MAKFFDEQAEQSQVKTAIVTKYFWAWAKIITTVQRGDKIAYVDLFAGPGRYKDGSKSTPVMILEQAIKEPVFCQRLVALFNDKESENTSTLKEVIDALPGINNLKHEPEVYTDEVGENMVKMFESMNLVPTLFFVDPWGYKGLSLRLINSVLKDWGCECIFFFNYGRINAGLSNPFVKAHMDALFGQKRAEELRVRLEPMTWAFTELALVNEQPAEGRLPAS